MCIIVLDNIRSALNVGAIMRTTDAVGAKSLYLCGITAYPPHPRLKKTALASFENTNWKYFNSTEEAIEKLKEGNYTVYTVEIATNAKKYTDIIFPEKSAFIFGHEISGISKDIQNLSDKTIYIPMHGKSASLNVATSVGIITYEYNRQINM